MGKNTDKLGTVENFKAPWETDAGETEIDKGILKRFIFNLSLNKAKAEDAAEEATQKVTEAEQKVKDAQDELAKADSTGAVADLQKKLDKAIEERDQANGTVVRRDVADAKGLTTAQAKFLQGATKEELEKSADEILETFGVKPATQETDEEREEREEREQEEAEQAALTARETPTVRRGLVNPADPAGNDKGDLDYEKIVAGFGNRVTV